MCLSVEGRDVPLGIILIERVLATVSLGGGG